MSSQPPMFDSRHLVRAFYFALLVAAFSAAAARQARAQDFTLTPITDLHAVNPGGSSTADLDLEPSAGGGTPGSVSFSTVPCAVTPVQTTGTPVCLVSPESATPPATPTVTVTTSQDTPAGTYTITVTGSDGSGNVPLTLALGVTPLTADYTLSVSPTTASPSPVPAGGISSTLVTVTPIGSYTGKVTLSCLSITPVVEAAPVCSFNPTVGSGPVAIQNGIAATATITITTLGPIQTTSLRTPRVFYALWLVLPGLALVGAGIPGRRGKRLIGVFLLTTVASGLLLIPACGSNNTNNPSGLTTPKNTYTFTISAVDQNGASPSNTTTSEATVTVTVN